MVADNILRISGTSGVAHDPSGTMGFLLKWVWVLHWEANAIAWLTTCLLRCTREKQYIIILLCQERNLSNHGGHEE